MVCFRFPLPSHANPFPSVLIDDAAAKLGDLYIRSLCFSPDGKLLATGAEDKQIRVSVGLFVDDGLIASPRVRFGTLPKNAFGRCLKDISKRSTRSISRGMAG